MRIAMVTPMLRYSGAPKMFAWLANQLSRDNEITLIVIFKSEIIQRLNENIRVIQLGHEQAAGGKLKKALNLISVEHQVLKCVGKGRYDVLISFGDLYTTLLLPHFSRRKLRTVVCERGDPNSYNRYYFRIRRSCFKKADKTVFQTEGAKRGYLGDTDSSSVIIPNPIKKRSIELPCDRERKKEIVTVSRLEIKNKRQDILIKSFAKLLKENVDLSDYTLVLYGDGADKDRLVGLTDQLQISDSVNFAGVVSEVENVIKYASLFLFTSEHEGIPNAIAEAMTVGLPVIATDCKPGGARLLIRDGMDGYIVPLNDENAIVEKMALVLRDKGLRNTLGRNAMEITNRFSEDKIIDMWHNVLNGISIC